MNKKVSLISEVHPTEKNIVHSLWWYDGDIIEVAGDDLYHYEIEGCNKILEKVESDILEKALSQIKSMLGKCGVEIIMEYASDD